MTKQSLMLTVALAVVMPAIARAADEGPTALSCRFDAGTAWGFEAGKFISQPTSPLAFEITDINVEVQTSKLISDGTHTGALRIVRALNANHFLEVVNEGFLNLTKDERRDRRQDVQPVQPDESAVGDGRDQVQ